jgi:trehalose 6-phosphate phosphatase
MRLGDNSEHEGASVVPPLQSNAALFLDVDRTLGDFQSVATQVDDALRCAIERIWGKLDGALALLSGRPIVQLDQFVGWNECAAAGVHGLERRDAHKVLHRPEAPAHLRNAVAILIDVLSVGDGVTVEDKGVAVALHFGEAPEREAALRRAALLMLTYLGPQYRLLEGANVMELLPRSADKGTAIRAFMAEAPFRGRQPVFVGDEVTDLDGFQAAREFGGYGVAVGSRGAEGFTLTDIQSVRQWLGVPV